MHATSISQAPASPMSETSLGSIRRRPAASTARCDTPARVIATVAGSTAAGAKTSMTATAPSSTGDHQDGAPGVPASAARSSVASSNGPYTGASAAAPRTRTATPAGSSAASATRSAAAPSERTSMRAACPPSTTTQSSIAPATTRSADGTARPYPIASGLDFDPREGPVGRRRSRRRRTAFADFSIPRSAGVGAGSTMLRAGAVGREQPRASRRLEGGLRGVVASGPDRDRACGDGETGASRGQRAYGGGDSQVRQGHAGTPRSGDGTSDVTAAGDAGLCAGRHSINAATDRSADGRGPAASKFRARTRLSPTSAGVRPAPRGTRPARPASGGSAKPNVRSNLAVASTPKAGRRAGSRVLGGRDRHDARGRRVADDGAGEVEPRRLPRRRQVIEAGPVGQRGQPDGDDPRGGRRERAAPVGHADLVGDDRAARRARGEPADRQQEVACRAMP